MRVIFFPHLRGLPHLSGVPHLHINRPLVETCPYKWYSLRLIFPRINGPIVSYANSVVCFRFKGPCAPFCCLNYFFLHTSSYEHLSLEFKSGYNMKTMQVFFAIVFFASKAFPGKCSRITKLRFQSFMILHQCAVDIDEGLHYSKNWFPLS